MFYIIILLQFQHLVNRLECLKNDKNVMSSDIICLQETSCNKGTVPKIPGYHYYSSGHGPNRGVGVFVKNFVLKNENFEAAIERNEKFAQFLVLSFSSFNVITVYRTHQCKGKQFEEQFIHTLLDLIDKNKQTIINGDFNFDYWDEQDRSLKDRLRHAGFIQIVQEPTTVRGKCIDHFYISSSESNFHYKLYYPYYADHEAIMVMVEGRKKRPTRTQIRRQMKVKNKTKK